MQKQPICSSLKLFALAIILLSACQTVPQSQTSTAGVSPTPTQTALPSVTQIPSPTRTVTPTPIPSEAVDPTGAPTLTLPPNQVYFFNGDTPDFVFPADPGLWEQRKPANNPYEILTHRTLPGCEINAVPGRGIGTPRKLLRWQLGRLNWLVYDYGQSALASIDEPLGIFLELRGHSDAECRAAQQAVLAEVLLTAEMEGTVAYNPLPTSTPRQPPGGFSCPGAPPSRLRVGDVVHLISDDVWLRSAPRAEESTRLTQLSSTNPYMLSIIDGPVCAGKYVYWQVQYDLIGGPPSEDATTGWLAEGDLQEYYLALGW